MPQKALCEMDDGEFLAMVDVLMEHLERQTGEDIVGGRAVSEIKDEIRRRIMERPSSVTEKPPANPISVEVERFRLEEVVPAVTGSRSLFFVGVPFLITTAGNSAPGEIESRQLTVKKGFFSVAEADAYLQGLMTARIFGLLFEDIPRL